MFNTKDDIPKLTKLINDKERELKVYKDKVSSLSKEIKNLKMKLDDLFGGMQTKMFEDRVSKLKENQIQENDFLKHYFAGAEEISEYNNIEEKDVPTKDGFSIDELESINTFVGRLEYCKSRLKYLGSGSSRVVFDLNDGEYVLKLAKNSKGLAQNEVEAEIDDDYYDLLAKCKYYEHKGNSILFIIMERAHKISESEFKKITDMDIKKIRSLHWGSRDVYSFFEKFSEYAHEEVGSENSDYFYSCLEEYVFGENLKGLGDLFRVANYGKVDREGEDVVVLIDYGLTDDVFNTYYNRKR